MPSPFPGMDPFIESSGLWSDFHGSLLAFIRSELNAGLPEGFTASIELCVWTAEEEGREPIGEPDLLVRKERHFGKNEPSAAVLAAPSTIVLPRLRRRKRKYVKVVDNRTKKVVTVIEVLSPANKKVGADRAAYIEKRNEYLADRLNFVEIDLLRAGRRPPLGRRHPEVLDYYAMVCRAWEFPQAGFWTFGIRDPLPEIPVPVSRIHNDTVLNLRRCIDQAYDGGRYLSSLPYDEPLKPQPRDADVNWVRSVLKSRQR